MGYMLKQLEAAHLLFLRKAGAPLDNNRCRTGAQNGHFSIAKTASATRPSTAAQTGDLFMSLIHTCRLNQINPFEYLMRVSHSPRRGQIASSLRRWTAASGT